jgi:hypothetical protein
MTFTEISRRYIEELKKEIQAGKNSGESTAELSYRTSLDNFFKSIAASIDPDIVTIPEPKNQSKVGRPDWRFHNAHSMGVYGYVESKALDSTNEIDIDSYRSQVEKYLTLGNPVILTDGIDFVLFKPNAQYVKYRLCNKPLNLINQIEINLSIEPLFKEFFGKIGYRVVSEKQLVNEVAKRARLLTEEILDFLDLEPDEAQHLSELNTLLLLKSLKTTAETSHDRSLSSKRAFSSFISQILTFGLLYAHRVVDTSCDNPSQKYQRIHDFWFSIIDEEYTKKLIPFRTLVNGLQTELSTDLSRLGLWYDDLRRLLSHIKLTRDQVEIPDFHELYETFLSIYDPETRFEYGAFYTPKSLAYYTVKLAISLIKDALPSSSIDSSSIIIDPCCGTGTFIEALLRTLRPNIKPSIIGFEILPAPYALAHYRMTMLKESYPDNVKIVLMNTLSDNLFKITVNSDSNENIGNILEKEQQKAYQLAIPPLTLIIGNPPSSDSKFQVENEGINIKTLIEDFRPSLSDRSSRQNIQKQLSNEFVKFLRWTTDRAIKSNPSLFILIIPASFAKHISYKYARKYLLTNFSLWVLEFDSDNRSGKGDTNIFNVLQGRLILAGLYAPQTVNPSLKYKSILHLTKEEKITFFEDSTISTNDWLELPIDSESYSFKPNTGYNRELYERFWPISDNKSLGIFENHCSSLKLAPTHLLVHASPGQLKRRSKYISENKNTYESIKSNWYSGQRKPPPESKLTQNVRQKLANAVKNEHIQKYSYRPFIETYVILDTDLLSELQSLGGGGTRDRPEVRAAYSNKNVIGFAVSPAPEDIGQTLHKFTSFCWYIPDNDLSARGNARIFCNYYPDYKRNRSWNANLKSNINAGLIDHLVKTFNLEKDQLLDSVTYYCYSILSSQYYMNMFKGKLYNVAGELPRIPITANKDLFIALSVSGKELADIESSEYVAISSVDGSEEIAYYKYSISATSVILQNENGQPLKTFTAASDDVINFEVSGYNVLKEWLKIHSFPYYRKALDQEKIKELENLIAKINIYFEVVQKIDLLVEEVIDGELLPPGNNILF